MPESRQLARLQTNLEKAGLLVDGKIVPSPNAETITGELSYQIYDGVRYLCSHSDCEKVAQLFGKEMGSKSTWNIINEIAKEFKLENITSTAPALFSIRVAEGNILPIDVTGYKYVVRIGDEGGEVSVKLDIAEKVLHISEGQKSQETIPVDLQTQVYEALVAKYETPTAYGNQLSKEALTFEVKGERYAVKLYLESLEIKNPDYSGNETGLYVIGYALVREV
ncbi:MAG: hypothetical protein LBD75_01350 [Candidatus Peribacteria bacterium]|nr:hypothetical protein [Candidatus Peribacteria bacterium]